MRVIRFSILALTLHIGFVVGCGSPQAVDTPPVVEADPVPTVVTRTVPVDYDAIAARNAQQIAEALDDAEANKPPPEKPPIIITPEPQTPTQLPHDIIAQLRSVAARMGDAFYRGDLDAVAGAYAELRRIIAQLD